MIKLNGVEVNRSHFPDGTLCMLDINSRKYKLDFLTTKKQTILIEWRYSCEEELSMLMMLKMYIDEKLPGSDVILDMMYIPNARMDRVKNSCEVFTLKFFSKIINSLNFNSVNVYDAHSNVSTALIDRISVKENLLRQNIINVCESAKADSLYFPDESAVKRYIGFMEPGKEYSKRGNIFYAEKHRDWETGEILGLDIKNVAEPNVSEEYMRNTLNNVVIIDDIISKGGSIYYALKKLFESGCMDSAKITIYASHVENSILEGNLWKEYISTGKVNLVTTDSIEHLPEVREHITEIKL